MVTATDIAALRLLGKVTHVDPNELIEGWRSSLKYRGASGSWDNEGWTICNFLFGCGLVAYAAALVAALTLVGHFQTMWLGLLLALAITPLGAMAVGRGVLDRLPGRGLASHPRLALWVARVVAGGMAASLLLSISPSS